MIKHIGLALTQGRYTFYILKQQKVIQQVGNTSNANKVQLLQVIPHQSYEIMQKQAYILIYQCMVWAIQFHGT